MLTADGPRSMNHRLERASLLSAPSKRGEEYRRLVVKGGRTYEMTAALQNCLRMPQSKSGKGKLG